MDDGEVHDWEGSLSMTSPLSVLGSSPGETPASSVGGVVGDGEAGGQWGGRL